MQKTQLTSSILLNFSDIPEEKEVLKAPEIKQVDEDWEPFKNKK